MSNPLWFAFKEVSDRGALFIVKPNPKYWFLQKCLQVFCFTLYITVTFLILINVIQNNEGIGVAAINSVFFIMMIVVITIVCELIAKKEEINDVISWFTEPTWKKFHKSLRSKVSNRFNTIRIICARLLLLEIKAYDLLTIFGTLLLGGVKQCFPSMRYEPPLPWHLPIEDYKNWKAFFIVFGLQFIVFFFLAQVFAFFCGLFSHFFLNC